MQSDEETLRGRAFEVPHKHIMVGDELSWDVIVTRRMKAGFRGLDLSPFRYEEKYAPDRVVEAVKNADAASLERFLGDVGAFGGARSAQSFLTSSSYSTHKCQYLPLTLAV